MECTWYGGELPLRGVDFFRQIRKYLRAMATLLEKDLPVSYVMDAVKGPLIIRRD